MGKLAAGVAVRDITPKGEMLAKLNAEGPYYYEDAYRPLCLKVLVLTDGTERFINVATDMSYFVENEDTRQAFKELGIAPKDIFFSGTRTHNSISGWKDIPFSEMPPARAEFGRYYLDTMVELIREATANAKPARIGATVVDSYINTFREQYTSVGNFEAMNHNGPRAPWLRVVRVEDLEHNTMAVLANYCMQNCSLYWNTFNGEFSRMTPDVAGEIINYVECAGKHEYPLFWSVGGGADQQAITYSLMDRIEVNDDGEFYYVHDHMPIDANLKLMRLYGCEQGQDILKAMENIDQYSDEFDYYSDEAYAKVPRRKSLGHPPMVFDPKKDDICPTLVEDDPVPFRFKMAVIDGIAFCGVNARTFSEVYKTVADMMPFDVTVFFDDCMSCDSGIAPPKYEEQGMNCHSSLQSDTYTMRMGYSAMLSGFNELLTKYALKTVPVYKNAPYPET